MPKGSKAVSKTQLSAGPVHVQAAPSLSSTTFLHALTVVPALALACSRALDHRTHGPGGGLKKLRSVSQGARVATQAAVQGFTLKLGQKATSVTPGLVVFLNTSQLLHLRINISSLAVAAGEWACCPAFWTNVFQAGLHHMHGIYTSWARISLLGINEVFSVWPDPKLIRIFSWMKLNFGFVEPTDRQTTVSFV